MDRRSFIIPRTQERCDYDECLCEEETVVIPVAKQKTTLLHLFIISLLAFGSAAVFIMIEYTNANATSLRQLKANVIQCSPFTIDTILPGKHSDPSDNNSNCPHQVSTVFVSSYDSKRKKSYHC